MAVSAYVCFSAWWLVFFFGFFFPLGLTKDTSVFVVVLNSEDLEVCMCRAMERRV